MKKEFAKATNNEVLKRISIVAVMDLRGFSKENIVRYCAENWNIELRQSEEYLKRARETFIEEACSKNIDEHLSKILMQQKDLYKECYSNKDYAECRRILKDIADLLGLNAPKKLDHTTNGKDINITPIQWASEQK
jgi:hypothetical protein